MPPADDRVYKCRRCRWLVVICRRCDHGNVYCKECAPLARKENQREAGRKYQSTDAGKENHQVRQEQLRDRRDKKVTHHPSAEISADRHWTPAPEMTPETGEPGAGKRDEGAAPAPQAQPSVPDGDRTPGGDSSEAVAGRGTLICHFCGQPCSARKRAGRLSQHRPVFRRGPRLPRGPSP